MAAVFILGGAFAGAIYVLRLPQLQIREIAFSGLGVLDKEDLERNIKDMLSGEKYWRLLPRSSIFLASTKDIALNLQKSFPRIERVSVKRSFPDKLEVVVKERGLFGIFCGPSFCAYIDSSGYAFDGAPSFSGSLITKVRSDGEDAKVGQNAVDPKFMERIVFLGMEIRRLLEATSVVYELSSKTPREVSVVTDEGFKILFNRDDDFANVFRVLETLLEEEIKEKRDRLDYIDVRFGNKAFYKLK